MFPNFSKVTLRALFLITLGILSICCSSSNEEGSSASNSILEEDEFLVLEKGSSSSYASVSTLIFTDEFSWQSHYSLHRGNEFNSLNTPYIDFFNEDIIVIHLGARPSPGYSINIISVTYDSTDNTMQVRYEELIDTTTIWPAVISYPYIFTRSNRSNLDYRFINVGTRNI